MEIGEDKPCPRRLDRIVGPSRDLVIFHPHQSYRAGAVPVIVGGFKVDGHKGRTLIHLQKFFNEFSPSAGADHAAGLANRLYLGLIQIFK
jgi:hypothetical protein